MKNNIPTVTFAVFVVFNNEFTGTSSCCILCLSLWDFLLCDFLPAVAALYYNALLWQAYPAIRGEEITAPS